MAVSVAGFKMRFPEFSNNEEVCDSLIETMLDDAMLFNNEEVWGAKYEIGIYYYTAHLIKIRLFNLSGNSSPLKPLTSRSVDGVSTSYSSPSNLNPQQEWILATGYGQYYYKLMRSLGVSAYVV